LLVGCIGLEKIMNSRLAVQVILCALWLFAVKTSAATFTLGAGNGSEPDGTYINEAAATTNYGTSARYWLGGSSSGTDSYVLLNWPALKDSLFGRTVDSCFVSVKTQAAMDNTDGLFACFQIRSGRDWIETQTTWNNYKTSTAWSTSGAKNTTFDIYSTPVDGKTQAAFSNGVYTPFDITSIARQWDGNDTANCRGVVLKQYGGTDPTQIDLASDDNATTGNRPKIRVVYHAGIDSQTTARRRKSVISLIDDASESPKGDECDLNRMPFSQTKDRP
jgi:hypothetical protein